MKEFFLKNKGDKKMSRELVLKWPIPKTVDKKLEKKIIDLTKEEVVLRLFKEEKISSGYGAKLLGISLADFLTLLKEKGIPFTQYTQEDWEKDKKAVDEMRKAKRKGKSA